jgi:hypothetical protein
MKNAIVLALVSLASANAFAAPKTARITSMNLDPNVLVGLKFDGGSLTIDNQGRDATLSLYHKQVCPAGRFCTQMIMAPMEVSLEIVSRKTNTCNAVVYTAMSDKRMVDGIRQVLTITDNVKNTCRYVQAIAPVEITYETAGQTRTGSMKTFSSFTAEAFVSAQN